MKGPRAALSLPGKLWRALKRRLAGDDARFDHQDQLLSQLLAELERQAEDLEARVDLVLRRQGEFQLEALLKMDDMRAHQAVFHREMRLLHEQMTLPPADAWQPPTKAAAPERGVFDRSVLCRQDSFENPCFPYWLGEIGYTPIYHRKLWEFVYILQALWERDKLRPGARGLGFGVGEEPLSAYFAAQGCKVTATDMAVEAAVQAGWTLTGEHAAGKSALRAPALCPDPVFEANVEFRTCDMNAIPGDLKGYDFCWSACALEHVGSIELGLQFIMNSLDCLAPGGVAVHTTEYNVSSNAETVSEGDTVLFRRRDLEELQRRVAAAGHGLAPLDLDPGAQPLDRYVDLPPYRANPHLKLALFGFAATSVGLIIQKSGHGSA